MRYTPGVTPTTRRNHLVRWAWSANPVSAAASAGRLPCSSRARAIRTRAADYLAGADPADPRVSPLSADLTGLPPLLIQAGSHEVLLDDATRLAARAAADDVAVILDITPGVPHVFQAFAALLDEGDAALNRAARFIQDNTAQKAAA